MANKDDEIVKVRRGDLNALIEANIEAYNLLDNIVSDLSEASTAVSQAFRILEEAPTEASDIIIEDEEEDASKSELNE